MICVVVFFLFEWWFELDIFSFLFVVVFICSFGFFGKVGIFLGLFYI